MSFIYLFIYLFIYFSNWDVIMNLSIEQSVVLVASLICVSELMDSVNSSAGAAATGW